MAVTLLVTTLSSSLDDDQFRLIKVDAAAGIDIRIVDQVAPYGIDSNPIDGVTGFLDETAMDAHHILGYLNQDALAEPGEIRVYSTDGDAAPKAFAWFKADGTIHLNGDADHAVRYSKLEEAFNKLKDDFNDLVQKFNSHTHNTPSGTSDAVLPTQKGQPSTADITPAKIDTIKTP